MIYVYDIDLSQIVYFWENCFTLVVVGFLKDLHLHFHITKILVRNMKINKKANTTIRTSSVAF